MALLDTLSETKGSDSPKRSSKRARLSKRKEGGKAVTNKTAPIPFPVRLHNLLDEAEIRGFTHVVEWQPDGVSFKVKDPEALEKILPHYFKSTKYRSFLRQLQDYGFSRVSWGEETGLCNHPYIIRGQRHLCKFMYRKQPNSTQKMVAISRIPSFKVASFSIHSLKGGALLPSYQGSQFAHSLPSQSWNDGSATSVDVSSADQSWLPELGPRDPYTPTVDGFADPCWKSLVEVLSELDTPSNCRVEEAAFEGRRFFTL